ncbi:Glycerol-3-phosphate cytidylyltransferase [Vibrio scophthalmi]|uniref:Glycerol-3-phosphate cytidylyltransferase n=1 Tax=Vibrio scophthalmi TaxID=45658 RepID=A0A1E3WJH2_9VIBR|nr:Glycerol-3-phosphate cytidylyltransferase [Vibrio scophthalmi]
MVVGISTDEFNESKGKQSFCSYSERAEIVAACKYVNEVFPERNWNQKRQDILNFNANIFAMGDDWHGKFDEFNDICQVIYLPRTENISTTDIKKRLKSIKQYDIEVLESSLIDALEVVKALSSNE